MASPRQFFFSYLFALLFWIGLSLGCFVVTLIHQISGGRWGYPTRRSLAGNCCFKVDSRH